MKKLLFLSSLFCCLSSFTPAQNLSLEYSQMTEVKNFTFIKNVANINGYILVARTMAAHSDELEIMVYKGSNLQFLTRKTIFGKKDKVNNVIDSKSFTFHSFLNLKGKTFILVESYIKNTETHELFAQEISQYGELAGKLTTIDKISADKRRNAGSFMITMSADSTKFLVIENPPASKDKKANESFGFKVYTSRLENLNSLSISLPLKDINVGVSDYALSNDNFIYMLVNVELSRKEKEKGESDDYYNIYKINPGSKQVSEINLNMPGRSVETVAMKINRETNKLFCAGLYSDLKKNKTEGSDIDGFFFTRFDPSTNAPEATKVTPLSPDMVNQLVYGKEKKNRKQGEGISDFFDIKTFDTRADGSALLIAEKRYIVITETCTKNGCYTNYHYYRQNMFVIDVKADGTVNTFTDIPKSQVSTNDNGMYSSYTYLQNNGKQYVIYNDNPENISPAFKTIKDVKTMSYVGKSALFATQIMKDGKYTKQVLVNNKEKQSVMMPEDCIQLSDDTYILPVVNLKKGCMALCACSAMFSKQTAGIVRITLK